MKNNPIPIVFSIVILLKLISICSGGTETETKGKEGEEGKEEIRSFDLYGNELPARIKWWKNKSYGLEITGDITKDANLTGKDLTTQTQAALVGKPLMEKKVDELIEKHKSNSMPDFTITKMDPISYEFEGQKMLITFKDIKLYNLDTYDKKSADYSQKGVYLFGSYDMDETMYNAIKKKGGELSKRTKMIDGKKKKPDKYFLERRDVEWVVKLSSKFITNEQTDWLAEEAEKRPIIIETEFKIQPDPKEKNQEMNNNTPLRAKGAIKIEFHDFNFALTFIVTHIDDPLRIFFPKEIKSDNLVPDFKATYGMESIVVRRESIKLMKYDGDDSFPQEIDKSEHVNENLPPPRPKEASPKKNSKIISSTEKRKFLPKNTTQEDLVAQHFEVLKGLVLFEKKNVEKRLYLNLLPKMAWKIMHMETKRQLPYLMREIIAFEDDFEEKIELPKVPLTDTLYAGVKLVGAVFNGAYEGVKGMFGRFRRAS